MLFNSLPFLLFFPVVCVLYYAIPSVKYRNIFLLAASYYFYMNWEPAYALLLLSSTAVTYTAAFMMGRCATKKEKRTYLVISLVINLLILFFFKYYYFAGENITGLMHVLGISFAMPDFDILLPVGISFYTFQALGYSIDVYRGTTPPERNFLTYALFVSFFPQLVAGPIERSSNLLPQFYTKHRFDCDEATEGLKTMLWGYFLKLVVADRCALYIDAVYNNIGSHPTHSTLVAAVLFCFQIYGDFAGYSFIAIGAARIMGFKLMQNFRQPYFATSITDFWRRWHISLTSWFKDYVYIPLGGNRVSKKKVYANIMTTFLISGFWHGASWTFVIWGGMHGASQCIERSRGWNKHKQPLREWQIWARRLIVFAIVCLSWVVFRANSLGDSLIAFEQIFSPSDFNLSYNRYTLLFCAIGILILFVKELCDEYKLVPKFTVRHKDASDVIWMSFLCLCIMFLGYFDGSNFVYFQF